MDPDPSGLTVPLSLVVPLSQNLTLLLTEESLHLELFRLLLVKVINRRIKKKWTQEENRIVKECYYRSKKKLMGIDNKFMERQGYV